MRPAKPIIHLALIAALALAVAACGDDGDGKGGQSTPVPTPAEPTPEPGGHSHIVLGSTASGAGDLTTDYDFGNVVKVYFTQCFGGTDSDCQGGMSLYSGEAGFEPLAADEATDTIFPLADGTELSLEITAIDENVQLKFEDGVLSLPGDSTHLGAVPDFHSEAEGQVVVPGVQTGGEYHVSFRIVDKGGAYGDSPEYTLTLTPAEGTPPPPSDD